MTDSAQCPACGNPQAQGLLDDACTTRLEKALGDVRWIVTELDTALSKMARIGTPGKGGLARERNPIHEGARLAGDYLGNTLTTWARDVTDGRWSLLRDPAFAPAEQAAIVLLGYINQIRRHPAAAELLDEVIDAVEQARRAVDRPADRQYLGQCMAAFPDEDGQDVTCYAEIWAQVDAHEVACRVCGVTHVVEERRAWLLLKAADMLCTVKEASRYMGDVGGVTVTEASIRGYIHRQRIAYRPGGNTIRLGDLLAVVLDEGERKSA